MNYGVVVIGRNEGERLRHCLMSLPKIGAIVYVDSGSNDGSTELARGLGVHVIELDMRVPFTAARARNVGFRRLRQISPNIEYVQFLDGDCMLIAGWLEEAGFFLSQHPDVAAVCGRRCERYPERSIYNWLCDREWDGPVGAVRYVGGDVMLRADAFEGVGGFRDDLIAGEEPELCVRLRAAHWRIWRLDRRMTWHDAAMMRFSQWWRRALRGGYAYAQGAYLHRRTSEHYRIWESRRAWIWGVWLPLTCLLASFLFRPWGWALWLIYPLQFLRQIVRNKGATTDRATLALFQLLARFPEGVGQIRFMRDRMADRRAGLIEYK
jgi:glycosyltransferase involved in cell wall biosynthesis